MQKTNMQKKSMQKTNRQKIELVTIDMNMAHPPKPALAKTLLASALFAFATLSLSACVTNRTFGDGIDDTAADLSMKSRLLQDGLYNYSDIDMSIFEGRLLLTGTMSSAEGRQHVEDIARTARGVREVLNEIIVGKHTTMKQGAGDVWIDERLGLALLTDSNIIRSNYQIVVSQGTVYLLGVAQGPNELNRAVDHARNMRGVKKVVSHVLYVGDPRREVGLPMPDEPTPSSPPINPEAPTPLTPTPLDNPQKIDRPELDQ